MTELSRRTIHTGRKFSFENIILRTPGGETIERQIVRHPGSVVILPILAPTDALPNTLEPRIVFIRNHRIGPGRELLELPAGTMEPPEPAEVCAARELEEETGYAADRLVRLTSFYTTPGMTDEFMHAFIASGLTHRGQHTEPDESIVVTPLPLSEAIAKMDSGEIQDAKSLLVLHWALRHQMF